ncbi:MAG: KH domain-containing protein, partial [Clostridia bacterium]|nr:KH domain-containing protein [Clostridia bacterium]
ISIDEVTIEIIQQETKGILGIGAKPAIVKLTQRPPEEYEVPDYLKPAEQRRERSSRRDDRRNRYEKRDRRDDRREQNTREQNIVETAAPVVKEAAEKASAAAETAAESVKEAFEEPAAEQRYEKRRREHKPAEEQAPAVESEPINYTLEEAQGNPAAEFVSGLIERMGAPGKVLAAHDEDCLRLRIDSEMMGMLIGHRGETLDAMQYLTSLVINRNRKTEGYTRVTLDTEDYREKREETLRRLAKKVASQVKATGRAKTLEPMNPYERRVLHSTLQNHPYVTTHSEGDEPNRRVVVTPRRRSRGNYRKPRYNGRPAQAEAANADNGAVNE